MKHLLWLTAIAVLLCVLVLLVQQVGHLQRQREARAGLDVVIAELPKPAGFDMIKIVYQEFYDDEHGSGPVCYYARAYIITGSSMSESDALATYAQSLQLQGWALEGEQYKTERGLIRGANERVVAHSGDPGVDIEDALDYAKLKEVYRSLIFVRVDYMIPSRDQC